MNEPFPSFQNDLTSTRPPGVNASFISRHVFQVMLGLFASEGLESVDYLESTNPGTLEEVSFFF